MYAAQSVALMGCPRACSVTWFPLCYSPPVQGGGFLQYSPSLTPSFLGSVGQLWLRGSKLVEQG